MRGLSIRQRRFVRVVSCGSILLTVAVALISLQPAQTHARPSLGPSKQSDQPDVFVTQLHLFLSPSDDELIVIGHYLLSNSTDTIYEGAPARTTGRRQVLEVTLPAAAEDIHFGSAGAETRFLLDARGFADTQPVPPGTGTSEGIFSYSIAVATGSPLSHTFSIPVRSVVILVPGSQLRINGPNISLGEMLETQMGPARSYMAGPLGPAQPLSFTALAASEPLAAVPAPNETVSVASGRHARPALEIAIGGASLVLALLITVIMWRSPSSHRMPASARRLVTAIVKLDQDLSAGRIRPADYERDRARLRAQLRSLLQRRSSR